MTANSQVVVRTWRGAVRDERRDEYVDYIRATGLAEYRATPGNLDARMLTRDLGDGRTEVVTLSRWESLDAIAGFAGDDIEAAVFYAKDDEFLVDRDTRVTHYLEVD